jgi:hypothetical protein
VSGNSIQATGAVAHAEFVLHFGLLSHDCNCRLARADPAHPVRIPEGAKAKPKQLFTGFRADLDFLLDVVDVATREGGVDDQSGGYCSVVNERGLPRLGKICEQISGQQIGLRSSKELAPFTSVEARQSPARARSYPPRGY